MSRRKGNSINGWVNLDKPGGPTSTQALGAVKRLLHPLKAGHAGTLDPLASGILPIALGEATKTIPYAQNALKTYSFKVCWGEERDTGDLEGQITSRSDHVPAPTDISAILPEFIGEITQIPPKYSAVKIDGQRAYDLAREGKDVQIPSRRVFIEKIELTGCSDREATFKTVCGKGTYVRSLAVDMARKLGTFGYISELRREAVGPFTLDHAISLDILEKMSESARLEEALLPLETVLDDIPALALREPEAARLKNGQSLSFISRPDMERLEKAGMEIRPDTVQTALALMSGKPIAIVNITGVEVKTARVFNL